MFLATLLFPLALFAQDGHEGHDHGHEHGGGGLEGLNFLGAADLYMPVHSDQTHADENRLRIRSAELSISGSVDQFFEGTLTFAGHTHGGNFLWDVQIGRAHV